VARAGVLACGREEASEGKGMSEQAMDPQEALEHAHHAAHETDPFIIRASLSIAVMAVIAATIGGFESSASNEAVLSKNEANLAQNKATDTWAFYQATSIKKNMYVLGADTAPSDKAAEYLKKAKDYEAREPGIEKEARGLETQVEGFSHDSDHHTRVHHGLTIAGTIEHVAIAGASIAVIARSRLMWYAAMALGGVGLAYALMTFVVVH
jgi:hypothetical protein